MAIEAILNYFKNQFGHRDAKSLVNALQQDSLVWEFILKSDQSQKYINQTSNELKLFSPGRMAQWLIQDHSSVPLEGINSLDFSLPTEIKRLAARTYESTFNTGLPPANLMTAGLLALTLRERRILKKTWDGISNEIFIKRSNFSPQKNIAIWQTPIACLYYFCQDFDDLVLDFIKTDNPHALKIFVPILIHGYLANPIMHSDLMDNLHSFISSLNIDFQLEALKWIHQFRRPALLKTIAQELIKSKTNMRFFSSIFSTIQKFDSDIENNDPLKVTIANDLPENVNRLAAFHAYSGNPEKAQQTYKKSADIVNILRSQILFQATVNAKGMIPDQEIESRWREIIESLPGSEQARLFYAQFLIEKNQYDRAETLLKALSDSDQKSLLLYQVQKSHDPDTESPIARIDPYRIVPSSDMPGEINYFIEKVEFNSAKTFLRDIFERNNINTKLVLAEKYLESQRNDPEIIRLTRDLYIKSQNYPKAIELTTYLNLLEPENLETEQTLAHLYMLSERWPDAHETLQHIIKSQPSPSIKILEWFAKSSLKTDREDMAISICQNILKQDPYATEALILLGEGFVRKGDIAKAIQHMEKVVEMIPEEAETWLALARLWRENGQADRAIEILGKGVLAVPESPILLLSLGRAHLEKNAPADAITYLKKANDLSPEDIEIKLDLAQAEYQLGQYGKAWMLLKPFMDSFEDQPQVARLLGHVLLAMDKKETAKPVLLLAAEQFPEDIKTVITATNLVLESQEDALSPKDNAELNRIKMILKRTHQKRPENDEIQLKLADMERLTENYQEALEAYLGLSEKNLPDGSQLKWRLQYGLGSAAMALNNKEMGLASLQEAAAAQPENLIVLHSLADAYYKSDLLQKANDTARAALKLAPQTLNNILWYAQFKIRLNEPEEAVNALKEALQIDPERTELRLWLSRTLISVGALAEAKQSLSKLISEPKTSEKELHQAAYLCLQLNNIELAVEALERAQRRTGETDPLLLMDLAVAYTLINQTKKALEILNQHTDLVHEYPELVLLKSDLLNRVGQFESALTALKAMDETFISTLGKDSPNDETTKSPLLYAYDFSLKGYYYRLGQLLRVLGDIQTAKESLQKAIDIAPKDIRVQNACIETFAMSLDTESALEFASKSPTHLPAQSRYNHDFLDMVCMQCEIFLYQEEMEKASTLFEKISHIMPTYPRSLALQSRLAQRYGEHDIARDYLEEAFDSYQITLEKQEITSLQEIFRQNTNLLAIADAALEIELYQKSIEYHKKAFNRLSNQPLQNLRYGIALLKAAEAQRVSDVLAIVSHAPGSDMLSQENYVQFQKQMGLVQTFIPEKRLRAYKARGISAFKGKWESYLNVDDYLQTTEDAAAFIIGSDHEKMIQNLLKTYEHDPKILQAYGIHALIHGVEDAAGYIEQALQMDMVNPVNYALLAFLKQDNPSVALRSLETALNFWPGEPEWHAMAADLQMKLGKTSSAARHINLALERQPENAAYWTKSARIRLEKQDLEHAKEDLQRSVSLEPENASIWKQLAQVTQRLGQGSQAIAAIQRAVDLEPLNIHTLLDQARLNFENHQYTAAEEITEEVIQMDAANTQAKILLANARAKQGKFQKALETLDEAIQFNPESTALQLDRIRIRQSQDGAETVLPDLIALAQKNPSDPDVLTLLTDLLIQTNRLEKAEQTAQVVLRILPDQADVHLMLGRLQRMRGQLDQAIDHLTKAITLDSQLVDAYIELGKTYQDRRDHQEAIKVYQQASQTNPGNPKPFYFAAMALKEIKDYKGAESMLKQAKRLAPDDPNIIRQLGVITALNLVNNLRETK
jgi:tetratricopeptide (TPR) repeat protein